MSTDRLTEAQLEEWADYGGANTIAPVKNVAREALTLRREREEYRTDVDRMEAVKDMWQKRAESAEQQRDEARAERDELRKGLKL